MERYNGYLLLWGRRFLSQSGCCIHPVRASLSWTHAGGHREWLTGGCMDCYMKSYEDFREEEVQMPWGWHTVWNYCEPPK